MFFLEGVLFGETQLSVMLVIIRKMVVCLCCGLYRNTLSPLLSILWNDKFFIKGRNIMDDSSYHIVSYSNYAFN